jgi:ferritin-like metal-binding protein YciE
MRWRLSEIPETIQNLQQDARNYALTMAEEFVKNGQDRVEALRQALERAQRMGDAGSAMGNVPAEREYHVVPSGNKWALRRQGEDEAEEVFEQKDKAVDKGVNRAKTVKGNLYVHDVQGRFEEIHSYTEPGTKGKGAQGARVRLETLEDLYVEQLQDLYSGEDQLITALERLSTKAHNQELKSAFESHLEETRGHKQKLEEIFGRLGQKPGQETCEAMAGIIYESEEILEACEDPDTCDAGLIASAQRVEHYEIAGYGSVATYAERLGYDEDLKVLNQILKEEKAADKKLTKIAESVINPKSQSKSQKKS